MSWNINRLYRYFLEIQSPFSLLNLTNFVIKIQADLIWFNLKSVYNLAKYSPNSKGGFDVRYTG
jgi:hypothetical protein